MSITFYASKHDEGRGYHMPLFPCDCSRRWLDACDACGPEEDTPESYYCEYCQIEINLANGNAFDLMRWLGVEADDCGTVDARELAAKCRRRLWDESRNYDPGVDSFVEKTEGHATLISCGRRPDYLREKTERMLSLAEKAGENSISWS